MSDLSLAKYKPVLIALLAAAFGWTICYIQKADRSSTPSGSLHRSNAQRRRRHRRLSVAGAASSIPQVIDDDSRTSPSSCGERYGIFNYNFGQQTFRAILQPGFLPTVDYIRTDWGASVENAILTRKELENEMLYAFLATHLPPGAPIPLTDRAKHQFVLEFSELDNIPSMSTIAAISRYESGGLQEHRLRNHDDDFGASRPSQLWVEDPDGGDSNPRGDLGPIFVLLNEFKDAARDSGVNGQVPTPRRRSIDDQPQENQSTLNLVYRIAEEVAKKEGYVHRGVSCNSCNTMPIRGIRFRCANCPDYDLCEQCEAMQLHDKTHLFFKVRIPAPFLSNPRQPMPVWYPGKPERAVTPPSRDKIGQYATFTGFSEREVEAKWEEFRCLAANEYPDDKEGYHIAIDRATFDKCFVPSSSFRRLSPNLIYDRVFSFYDTDGNGLIGWLEFVEGLACVSKDGMERRLRIFHGYDLNGDGFVDRGDFLKMFEAHYTLTKELTRDIVSGTDDEYFDEEDARDVVAGSQPISATFSGPIPPPGRSHEGIGKVYLGHDQFAKLDDGGPLSEGEKEKEMDRNEVAAIVAHFATSSNEKMQWHPSVLSTQDCLNDDQWPPKWVQPQDVQEALGRWDPPEAVSDTIERCKIIICYQEMAEQEHWKRSAVRKRAVYKRWCESNFFLNETSVETPWYLVPRGYGFENRKGVEPDPNELTALRLAYLEHTIHDEGEQELRDRIENYIKIQCATLFPNPSQAIDQLIDLVKDRLDWLAIAEKMAPTRDTFPETAVFVHFALGLFALGNYVWFEGVEHLVENCLTSPSSRRSRSSSKVRFEDELDTNGEGEEESRSAISVSSRSIPVGERWGGSEIPDPVKVAESEVIYKLTQASFNGVLNSLFGLREDLWMECNRSMIQMGRHRPEVDSFLTARRRELLVFLSKDYQMRWNKGSQDPAETERSEADQFFNFIQKAFDAAEVASREAKEQKETTPLSAQGNTSGSAAEPTVPTTLVSESLKPPTSDSNIPTNAPNSSSVGRLEQDLSTSVETPAEEYPAMALELHDSVTSFNEANTSIEESIRQKPLDTLLTDSGYTIADTPEREVTTSAETALNPWEMSTFDMKTPPSDPTLPQNRPNNSNEKLPDDFKASTHERDETPSDNAASDVDTDGSGPLSREELIIESMKLILLEEDMERGGPGRLSRKEFLDILKGRKSQGLGWLGSWVEIGGF
ncbi:MAG: hypothetical protein LQ351_000176 [Letrouitia transgressa]|nr:MAG: hypothetical protein LQ351_000176 [Letrouitia transgressa]